MNEYTRDIEDIKDLLKKIQTQIAQLEVKIEAEPSADHYHFTMPAPVPSTQACKMDR